MNSRFAIGLTGGIGSGKTTVANYFGELGAALIDTDLIAHQLTQPGGLAMEAIRQSFGAGFVTADGAMDRARMRELVFSEPDKKRQLEAILHPLIRQQTELAASQANGDYLIFVVPLLVESGNWRERVQRIVVVDCEEATQIRRVMQRNQLSEAQVRAIMNHQASRQQRLAAADDVISNEGELYSMHQKVQSLHQHYCQLAAAQAGKSAGK